jgi:hypothetical protein
MGDPESSDFKSGAQSLKSEVQTDPTHYGLREVGSALDTNLNGAKFWIITEAAPNLNPVLLPEDY